MKIDMTALRSLEREKDIALDLVVEAIESALLTAYRHSEGAASHARVELDRKTGEVAVLVHEVNEEGAVVGEYDDTPADFGRIATMTAKQVILQRLREAEHDNTYGEYAG
ncbi:MAG: NusA domain protein, partial [Frankiales bacterium]|nr:NusA domain protein [Frankiales bacterium]